MDTDDRSFLQTLGDAGYSALMGAAVGGVVQTAGSVFKGVRSDPKALAQQAADAAIAQFKAQTGDAAKPTLAQQIDSMRQQLADTQHKQKVDALMKVYEENVPAVESLFNAGSEGNLAVTGEEPDVQRILEIVKNHGKIELTEDLEDAVARMPFSKIEVLKEKLPDRTVRKWYLVHDSVILQQVDQSGDLEQRARQAFELRNMNRKYARDLMANREKRMDLDRTDPNKTFEELISDKMKRKGLTREEALQDILNTAEKTRASVNKMFGLGDNHV